MDMVNKAFIEVMIEGDAEGRGFQYPIPTYSITRDFDWSDTENNRLLFEMTSKYGTPYFSNYVNSDMEPSDVRSMCCRLRLDLRELRKKSGGYFGSGESTGSVGVVQRRTCRASPTLPPTRPISTCRLDDMMDIAARSLKTKRTVISQLLDAGLYPYTKRYLGGFGQRLLHDRAGGHERSRAQRQLASLRSTDPRAQEFAAQVLEPHARVVPVVYQERYGDLYNLEATPAESTSYRLAKHDKEQFPDIVCAGGQGTPYYINSSHLPVGYTDDVFSALDVQDDLQTRYTSGTVFHAFLGEKLPDWRAAAQLVRAIAENYRLPYYTPSPTYSVCRTHGYLAGEQRVCPQCGAETEVYSRITGYYRPLKNWNEGKAKIRRPRTEYAPPRRIPTKGEAPFAFDEMRCATRRARHERRGEDGKTRAPCCPRRTRPGRLRGHGPCVRQGGRKRSGPGGRMRSETGFVPVTTAACPNCRRVKPLLSAAGIAYRELRIDEDAASARSLRAWLGVMAAPTLLRVAADGSRMRRPACPPIMAAFSPRLRRGASDFWCAPPADGGRREACSVARSEAPFRRRIRFSHAKALQVKMQKDLHSYNRANFSGASRIAPAFSRRRACGRTITKEPPMDIVGVINLVDSWVWGPLTIVILLGSHVYLTIRTRFIQRKLPRAIKLSVTADPDAEGDISQFGALTTALSATIGTGNIIGVATAIIAGGPGAVLWMWLTGVFGMATKYSEVYAAVKYRVKDSNGEMHGGAMYAWRRAFPRPDGSIPWWAKLGSVAFALFAGVASLGIGSAVQSSSMAGVIYFNFPGIPMWALRLCHVIMVSIVIFGGVKVISRVCEKLVPFMAIAYVWGCVVIIGMNWEYVWPAIKLIFECAFTAKAAFGGAVGSGIMLALQFGCARGLFSNESGLGVGPDRGFCRRHAQPGASGARFHDGHVLGHRDHLRADGRGAGFHDVGQSRYRDGRQPQRRCRAYERRVRLDSVRGHAHPGDRHDLVRVFHHAGLELLRHALRDVSVRPPRAASLPGAVRVRRRFRARSASAAWCGRYPTSPTLSWRCPTSSWCCCSAA